MNRLLGKGLGPQLDIRGVLDQAAMVRQRWLPRLARLLQGRPHATNRYLNLLAFFARVPPEQINAWRATLDQARRIASRQCSVHPPTALVASSRPPRQDSRTAARAR